MKIIFSIIILFLTVNYGFANQDCAFWLCNVDTTLVWNTDTDIKITIISLVKYFLTFLSIISIAFVIKWGFQILTAAWDDEKVKSWRKTILYALLWIFIIIIAYSIVSIAFDAWKAIEK